MMVEGQDLNRAQLELDNEFKYKKTYPRGLNSTEMQAFIASNGLKVDQTLSGTVRTGMAYMLTTHRNDKLVIVEIMNLSSGGGHEYSFYSNDRAVFNAAIDHLGDVGAIRRPKRKVKSA